MNFATLNRFPRIVEGEYLEGGLTSDLMARLEATQWPGNVRQLRNAIARRIALGDLVGVPAETASVPTSDVIDQVLQKNLPLVQARQLVVEAFEQRYLERVLAAHGGNVTNAAAGAGIARRHFQRLRARAR